MERFGREGILRFYRPLNIIFVRFRRFQKHHKTKRNINISGNHFWIFWKRLCVWWMIYTWTVDWFFPPFKYHIRAFQEILKMQNIWSFDSYSKSFPFLWYYFLPTIEFNTTFKLIHTKYMTRKHHFWNIWDHIFSFVLEVKKSLRPNFQK